MVICFGERGLLSSKAITKIQSIILIAIIAIAAVGGAVYVLNGNPQQTETIKIGIVGDIDYIYGKAALQGAILAAEEINSEGGVLGRNIEIIEEDSDSEQTGDTALGISALTRLITHHQVEVIITPDIGYMVLPYQDIVSEHEKILMGVRPTENELTQRVLDDYNTYKYFFRVYYPNETSNNENAIANLLTAREYTGFNKVGYLIEDLPVLNKYAKSLEDSLDEIGGFDLIYKGKCPPGTVDFTSYFAAAEAAGIEILFPMIVTPAGISFVKEWYDRQSPFIVWGVIGVAQDYDFWDSTDGKGEYITSASLPVVAGYPYTSETIPLREAYFNRWGSIPNAIAASSYDVVRFILYDAFIRAGTTETEEVISALEETSIETSAAKDFVFTSSHDVLVDENPYNPTSDYLIQIGFQWQNGEMVPVYPKKIMEEARATYLFPDWPGPWDNIN